MATVSVRYIVNDVDAAIDFYCQHLGFREEMHPAPTFAILSRGDLRAAAQRAIRARRWRPGRCPTAPSPSPEAGTASPSRSPGFRR